MGQMIRQTSEHTTHYVWYPGNKKNWLRAALAVALGCVVYLMLHLFAGGQLWPIVAGTSVTSLIAGINYGRRDSRAVTALAEALARPDPDPRAIRRRVSAHAGNAAWRGVVEGAWFALAAVLIANVPPGGFLANWVWPLMPAVVGALAHQFGVVYSRLGQSRSAVGPAGIGAAGLSSRDRDTQSPVTEAPSSEPGRDRSAAKILAPGLPKDRRAPDDLDTTVPSTLQAARRAGIRPRLVQERKRGRVVNRMVFDEDDTD